MYLLKDLHSDEQMWYFPYKEMLHSNEKKETIDSCTNMDESQNNYVVEETRDRLHIS